MCRVSELGCCIAALTLLVGCGGNAIPTRALPTLVITTVSLPDGMVTFAYSRTIQASGGIAPFNWTVSSGTLPRSVTLEGSSTSSATISGTPDTAQMASFTIRVTDAKNQIAAQSYAVNIKSLVAAQLQGVQSEGHAPAGTVEIQNVSAGVFNPTEWQENTQTDCLMDCESSLREWSASYFHLDESRSVSVNDRSSGGQMFFEVLPTYFSGGPASLSAIFPPH